MLGATLAADVTKVKPGCLLDKAITASQSRRPTQAHGRLGCAALASGLLLLGFLGGVTGALAQGILAPSSADFEKSTLAPALPGYQTGGLPPPGGLIPQTLGPVQLGPVDFHPHLLYQFIYGDGIPSAPTNHLTSAIQEISPGLLLDIGAHWTLDYTPTLIFYSNPQLSDTTSHNASLNGRTQYEDWAFGLSQGYTYSAVPEFQTEAPTAQTSYTTGLTASRRMGSQFSAQWSLDQTISSSSLMLGSTPGISQNLHSWVLSSGLIYQTDYGMGFGINGSGGWDLITPGANMTFEQVQGTFNWQVLGKISVEASCGLEVSQLMGAQLVDPTYSGAITYRPFEQTSASLVASRSVAPAQFTDEVTENTSINATFRQRFLQYFSFELSGGYSSTPYVGFATAEEFNPNNGQNAFGSPLIAGSLQQNRTDNSRFARVSLGSNFRQRGSISIFYTYSDTTSSLAAYALTSTQVGIEIGWRY